jgi:aminopeptidase N
MRLPFRRPLLNLGLLALAAVTGCAADGQAGELEASEDDLVFRGTQVGAVDASMPDVDAIGYEVDIRVDESTAKKESYRATVKGTFVATAPLGEVALDFAGNEVDSVRVSGRAATFRRERDKLVVKLPTAVAKGRAFSITTAYHGALAQADGADSSDLDAFGGLMVMQKNTNQRKIYASLNWPSKARRWLPLRDHPRDGAMFAVRATFPEKYVVVSNGKRVSAAKNADGTKTWQYEALTPMPPYDVSLTAYDDWAESEARSRSGVPIKTFTYSSSTTIAKDIYQDVPRSMDFYEGTFGPYRWGSLAYLEEPIFGGGMEHASVVSMDQSLFRSPRESRLIAFHELGHHWSGNLARIGTWNDFWLSEGFTDYLTRRAAEALDGEEEARKLWRSTMARALEAEAQSLHPVRPPDPEKNVLEFFDDISYQKGAWVLRMLEKRLGRDKMDAFLKGWFERHAFKAVTTSTLEAELAPLMGPDAARAFFDQFVRGEYHPEYAVTFAAAGGGKTTITVKQLQSSGPREGFAFPLALEVAGGGEKARVTVDVTGKTTSATVAVPFEVASVQADPDETVYGTVVCTDTCRTGYRCERTRAPHSVCVPR